MARPVAGADDCYAHPDFDASVPPMIPSVIPHVGRPRWRHRMLATNLVGGLALAASLSACGGGSSADLVRRADAGGRPAGGEEGSTAVIASPLYAARVGSDRQTAALAALEQAILKLRRSSTSGWQVRQDDTTGVGSELSGGVLTYPPGSDPLAIVERFVTEHGNVFGLRGIDDLALPARAVVDDQGIATVRATQSVRGVPVEGTNVLVVVRKVRTQPEIGFARAHVYPHLSLDSPVDTTPLVDAAAAKEAAAQRGAVASGEPTLVISNADVAPSLVWRIEADYTPPADAVTGIEALPAGPVIVYIDAHSGEVRRLARASTLAFRSAMFGGAVGIRTADLDLPDAGTPVDVTGKVRGGLDVTLKLEKLADGSIAFVDASQPKANRKTRKGLNIVFDASQIAGEDELPGKLLTLPAGTAPDVDTLTAAWAAKVVLDYYRTAHSRASWDGKGAPLISSIKLPDQVVHCNAYFNGDQMVYGGPCDDGDGGKVDSFIDLSIVGHEITHGVTTAAAPLLYESTALGGALHEGNSDYFGVVIQDTTFNKPWSAEGTTICDGKPESRLCHRFDDGVMGGRNIDNGSIFDDAQLVLREPLGLLDRISDVGAAHGNSLIWTNALWQIRKAFASEDGGNLVTSKAAARFDRIVYRAITNYFTNETDMPAAASAVLQAAVDLDASGPERDLIQQQFVISQLCVGCTTPAQTQTGIATSPRIESKPVVLDTGVAYLEQIAPESGSQAYSRTLFSKFGEDGPSTVIGDPDPAVLAVSGAGDWVVEARYFNPTEAWVQLTNVVTGASEKLGAYAFGLAAPAASRTTAVWVSFEGNKLSLSARAVAGGATKTHPVDHRVTHLAIDGSVVAFQTEDGAVSVWDLGSGEVTRLVAFAPFRSPFRLAVEPGGIAVSGRKIAVLGIGRKDAILPTTVVLFDLDSGAKTLLSNRALPAGVTMDGNRVVWSEVVGAQPSGVSAYLGDDVPESELAVYAIDTGSTTFPFKERGQQGFPAINGVRVAWQDTLSGGDDVYAADLPEGS